MQWNRLLLTQPDHPLVAGLAEDPWVYFVHSYAAPGGAEGAAPGVVAVCDYGGPVVAAVASGTVWATQFHPEKSGVTGLAVLANFVAAAAGG
jgi:glutamine amidotransferase